MMKAASSTASPSKDVASRMNFVVDLPLNDNSSPGFVFTGSPPIVSAVLGNFPNLHHHKDRVVGSYVQSLKLPGVEISGFPDAASLEKVLVIHQNAPRQLILTTQPPNLSLPSSNSSSGSHQVLYTHHLPAADVSELGIEFDGFPAKVKAVSKDSPLAGLLIPGQFVHAVCVPGAPDLRFESGGFTGPRISTYLHETSNLGGRRLIVKDDSVAPKSYSDYETRDPFDFGGFLGNPFRRQRTAPRKQNQF
jgi:hypothetical protein